MKKNKEFTFYKKDIFCRGIYYLFQRNEIVYVGMSTTNCLNRILSHEQEGVKKFDRFTIIKLPRLRDKDLLLREKKAIQKYSPKYNVIHNRVGNPCWMSLNEMRLIEAKQKTELLPKDMPMEFQEKYHLHIWSDKWFEFKKSILESTVKCESCFKKKKGMEVYHKSFSNLFNETRKDMIVLCGGCRHSLKKK